MNMDKPKKLIDLIRETRWRRAGVAAEDEMEVVVNRYFSEEPLPYTPGKGRTELLQALAEPGAKTYAKECCLRPFWQAASLNRRFLVRSRYGLPVCCQFSKSASVACQSELQRPVPVSVASAPCGVAVAASHFLTPLNLRGIVVD
jgi:hypothetical protein